MSEGIDIPVVASGDDGVNRLTTAIDRLTASMEQLGAVSAADQLAKQMEQMQSAMNTALGSLNQQMLEMRQVFVTGFADISATNQKLIEAMGQRQARAIEAAGDVAAAATVEAGLKIKAADARTWEQIGRGSASNVTAAFYQLSQGIPVEAVTARYGELAAATAQSLDGQIEKLKQFQANAKSLYETAYKPMAAPTEAEIAALRVKSASPVDARTILGLPSEDAARAAGRQIAAQIRAGVEAEKVTPSVDPRALLGLPAEAEMRGFATQLAVGMRTAVEQESLRARSATPVDPRTLLGLPSQAEARAAGQQIAAQMREAVTQEGLRARSASTIDARTLLGLPSEAEVRTIGQQIAAQMREAVAAEQSTDRQRALNARYLSASPASQVRTAAQAQIYGEMGGDAAARYGSVASAADALAAAEARLAAASRGAAAAEAELAGTARGAATAQLELNDVMRQAEGAFRGAAHQAGIYGLHHGQLIALLAGGAVAAALHHIAETGAEVEFQLKSLNALSGDMTPIDINKFIGISAGTMTDLKDAAEGVHALAQAGLSQAEVFRALPDVMRLAQLGEMHVAEAAEMAVESMHAFGLTSADIGRVGDTLVAVGSQANVSVHKLAEDMKSAAVTGQLFNLKMEEITATVGALAERGLTIQPLSSALNKLYEPSAKTAKAMQEMGLSVRDASGQFKPYTQFIHELSDKVNEFKEAGDPLKMLGMTPQSIKAMEVMTQHVENYDHLLHVAQDSANKMFEATAAKADTVEGAWKQLGSTFQGVLANAFEDAKPTIRQIEEDLQGLARSGDVQAFFSGLAIGVANVTRALIEGRGTIESMVLGYAALKVAPPILEAVASATVFLFGRTTAATAAIAAEGTAATVATGQLELFATSETAAAAGAAEVAATATTAEVVLGGFAAATRTALSVLAPLGLALAAVSIGYELFRGASSKAQQDHDRMNTSIDSTITSLEQELNHLNDLQVQLEKTGRIGAESAYQVQLAFAQMEEANAKARLDAATEAAKGPRKLAAGDDGTLTQFESNESGADLVAAKAAYAAAQTRAQKLVQLHDAVAQGREAVQIGNDISKLEEKIKSLPHELEGLAAANPKKADSLREQVDALGKLVVTKTNYNEALQQEKDLEAAINSGKRDAPKIGDSDDARTSIELLQEQLRLKQMQAKSDIEDAKSANKRGELGDLQLINRELEIKLDLDRKGVEVARAQLAAAGPLKGAQRQKYANAITTAEAQIGIDQNAADRAKQDALDKMSDLELKARAKSMESQGHLEDAFLLQWEAKNRATLDNLSSDIADAQNSDYRDALVRYKQYLEQQRALGANDARFNEAKNAFGATHAELSTRLSSARLQAGPGSGLFSVLSSQMEAQQAYADMIPQMQAAQAKLAPTSSIMRGGDMQKIKEAQNELRVIQEQMAAMRNLGVDMGNAIARALSDAFGKGGQALGGMIVAATAYDAKMKDIKATLADSGKTDADRQKAADDIAAAQIKGYGDMAGAAKGFFDTNSKGYKVLSAAEKAFRILEITQSAEAMAKKIIFKEAEVAATVTGDATKSASGVAAAAVDVVNAGVSAAAWGVTAVARAIASMPFPLNLAAGAATLAALVAVGVNMVGGFGGGGGSQSEAEKQQANQTGTVLGDPDKQSESIAKSLDAVKQNTYNNLPIAQGMLTALQSIEGNITSFVSLLFRDSNVTGSGTPLNTNNGLGRTLAGGGLTVLGGVAAGPLGMLAAKVPFVDNLINKVGNTIFGGKQTLTSQGFTMGKTSLSAAESLGVNAMSYADIHTDGGWFSHSKNETKTSSLGAEANLQISKVLTGLDDTITSAAGMMGMSGAAFKNRLNSFVVDIGKIDLKGLSSSDAQAKINAAFSKLGDQMAQFAVGGLEQFQQAGEGYLQTLTRVAVDYATVDTVFKSLGTTYAQVGTSSIAAREHLIELAGGLDKFTSQASWFFQNMLTQGQQTAATRAEIDPILAKYGLSTEGKDAVQKFTQATIAFGAMGDAGAQAYTDLMNVAQAFKSVTDVATDLQNQLDDLTMTQAEKDAAARAKLDPQNQLLFDQVQKAKTVAQAKTDLASAYQTESQAMQSAIDRLKTFSTSLRSFVVTLQTGNLSLLNPADKYGAAMAQFDSTLAKARAGDTTAQGNLQSAAQAFLQASKDANASNSTYQSDFNRVTSAMSSMADLAETQADTSQSSLNALYAQVTQLTDINAGVNSVAEGINNLMIAMTGGQSSTVNGQAITSLYQELLGHAPDDVMLKLWNIEIKSGEANLASIADQIKHTAEYANYQNSKGAVSSPLPSTQYGTATVPTTPTTTDLYSGLPAANSAFLERLLTSFKSEFTSLRTDLQQQSATQVAATLKAASDNADEVSGAVSTATQTAAWAAQNTANLR
jgi:TP901 family phage tail tape measure protein